MKRKFSLIGLIAAFAVLTGNFGAAYAAEMPNAFFPEEYDSFVQKVPEETVTVPVSEIEEVREESENEAEDILSELPESSEADFEGAGGFEKIILTNNQSILICYAAKIPAYAINKDSFTVSDGRSSWSVSQVVKESDSMLKMNFDIPLPAGEYTLCDIYSRDTIRFTIGLAISIYSIPDSSNVIVRLSDPIVGCDQAENYVIHTLEGENVTVERAGSAYAELPDPVPNVFRLTVSEEWRPGTTYVVETRNMFLWQDNIENSFPGDPCQGTIAYFTPEEEKKGFSVYALTNNQSIIMRSEEEYPGLYDIRNYQITDEKGHPVIPSYLGPAAADTGVKGTVKINFPSPLDVGKYRISSAFGEGTFAITLKISPVKVIDQRNVILQLSSPIVGCTDPGNYLVRKDGIIYEPVSAVSAFAEMGAVMPNVFRLTFACDLADGFYEVETRGMKLWKDNDESSGIVGEPCQGTINYIEVRKPAPDLTTVEGVTQQFLDQYITENMTDLEKELMIVRWMVENIRYDEDGKGGLMSYEAYGAMVNHCAVCDGYAKAFEILGKACGLNVCRISGVADNGQGYGAENHAWNMILLDGSWYHVDVTWDDPLPEPNGYGFDRIRNAYINLTDAELSATHTWTPVHSCTSAAYGRAVIAYYIATGIIDQTMTPDRWRDYVLDHDLNEDYPLTQFGCRYDDGRNFFKEEQTDLIAAYMKKQFDMGRTTCILAIDTADMSLAWFTPSWFFENVCRKSFAYSYAYSVREGYISLVVHIDG